MALPREERLTEAAEGTRWSPAARELVGGVLAGAVNVTSGYPFDTMKVHLQTSGGNTSMADCFWGIWRTQGVRGFFRGLSSPLIGGAAETGVNYLIYSRVLDILSKQQQQQQCLNQQLGSTISQLQPHLSAARQQQQQQQQQQQLSSLLNQQHQLGLELATQHEQLQQQQLPPMRAIPVAGAIAGVALSIILSPTELVKCRMQMGQHTSPIACLKHVVASEGVWGLSRGFKATLCREIPGNAIFFTVYEGLRRTLPGSRPAAVHGGGSSSSGGGGSGGGSSSSSGGPLMAAWRIACDAGGAILCGGVAGVVMWGTVLPLDVAKTRIQTAQPGSSWDTGVLLQLRQMFREGGRKALWAGLSPTLMRAFPANACQWLAWEVAMQQLLPPAYEGDSSGSSGHGGSSSTGSHSRGLEEGPAAAAAAAAVAAAAAASTAAAV